MEKVTTLFSGAFGFHISLVLYFLAKGSNDWLLHVLIFLSGVIGVLVFSVSKVAFENRIIFIGVLIMIVTTFISSLILAMYHEAFGNIFKWLIMVVYNIASTRSMRLVDIEKVAKRNIIINTLILALNLIFMGVS